MEHGGRRLVSVGVAGLGGIQHCNSRADRILIAAAQCVGEEMDQEESTGMMRGIVPGRQS